MLLVLLFTLMTFAMAPFDEQFGEDDSSFMEIGMIYRTARDFFSGASIVGFELGVFLAIVRLEYLRGHIGEKRLADRLVGPNIHLSCALFLRRLLIGPSFLFLSPLRMTSRD